MRPVRWPALFLISLGTVAFEIALSRFFAVSKWSEYGYWVISIVLAGFAVSGVAIALARAWFVRHGASLVPALPAALVTSAAAGYWVASGNPFNPLQLQNSVTLVPQLGNIALYYAALLPFFALAGLFISLCFLADPGRLGRVYGVDLTGAGCGALAVLGLMEVAHPFALVAWLLLPLAGAAVFVGSRRGVLAAGLALLAGETLLLGFDRATTNDFKAVYAPLHVEGSRVLAETRSPRGLYQLLDDFTERVDTDLSNNAGLLGLPGPPTALGLYRDGNRIAGLPKPGAVDAAYAGATLAALPYTLHPGPRVLLVGVSGGFRVAEALALGAAAVDASEVEPLIRAAVATRDWPPNVRILADPPLLLLRDRRYDLVDIAGDLLDAGEANAPSLTVEALAAALENAEVVSVPVSIREFPAYATRMLATVRAALLRAGAAVPGRCVIAVRSAWNLRILASLTPFDAATIAAARAWADARSFDVSYYPGIDVTVSRASLYNDLPAVSFADAAVTSGEGLHDAVADEAGAALAGAATPSAESFDLSPVTLDRPSLNAVLRLSGLSTILRRLELLPQGEVAPLVNLAVLAQAVILAAFVLLLPLLAGRRLGRGLGRPAVYFAALGLGFLMIEIAAIEAAALLLTDRTWAFALVLTAMLVFSGLGSLASGRFGRPRRALLLAVAAVLLWCAAMLVLLPGAVLAGLSLPFAVRAALLVAALAPVSVALGLPFPLGLARLGDGPAVPWAWALNGAFSVVATPLANLIATEQGHARVLQVAVVLYVVAAATFPRAATEVSWTPN